MKKRILEKELRRLGWHLVRQGKHEIWSNGHLTLPVPRHRELKESTARGILMDAAKNPPSDWKKK